MTAAEAWIDLLLNRSAELRRAGVLSIGVDGCSAVLAPADPEADEDEASTGREEGDEPINPWEHGGSYPTGRVPSLGEIEKPDEMPEIPAFGDG